MHLYVMTFVKAPLYNLQCIWFSANIFKHIIITLWILILIKNPLVFRNKIGRLVQPNLAIAIVIIITIILGFNYFLWVISYDYNFNWKKKVIFYVVLTKVSQFFLFVVWQIVIDYILLCVGIIYWQSSAPLPLARKCVVYIFVFTRKSSCLFINFRSLSLAKTFFFFFAAF